MLSKLISFSHFYHRLNTQKCKNSLFFSHFCSPFHNPKMIMQFAPRLLDWSLKKLFIFWLILLNFFFTNPTMRCHMCTCEAHKIKRNKGGKIKWNVKDWGTWHKLQGDTLNLKQTLWIVIIISCYIGGVNMDTICLLLRHVHVY